MYTPFDYVAVNPTAGFVMILGSVALAWGAYLLAWHRQGPTRLLLLSALLMAFSTILPHYLAAGLWSRGSLHPGLANLANLAAIGVCFVAIAMLSCWQPSGRRTPAAAPQDNVTTAVSSQLPDEADLGAVDRELTTATIKVLKTPISANQSQLFDDRRRFRVPIDCSVRVEVLDRERGVLQGSGVDFSGDGIGMLLDGPVAIHAIVLVHTDAGLLLGEVAHCHILEEGYRIGLRVDQFLSRTESQRGNAQWRTPSRPVSPRQMVYSSLS